MTWYISVSEESGYYGSLPTREEAIAEGIAEGHDIFYIGEGRPPKPLSHGVFADQVIEHALETLDEEYCFDDWCHFDPTKEQVKELEEMLRAAVDKWVKQNNLTPTWFLIDNAEKIDAQDYEEAA